LELRGQIDSDGWLKVPVSRGQQSVTLPRDSLSLTVGNHTVRAFIFDGTDESDQIALTYAVLENRPPAISLTNGPAEPLRFLSSGPIPAQGTFAFLVSNQETEDLRFTYEVGGIEYPFQASLPGPVEVAIPPERFEGALNPGAVMLSFSGSTTAMAGGCTRFPIQ
jgi:hypothetical protein